MEWNNDNGGVNDGEVERCKMEGQGFKQGGDQRLKRGVAWCLRIVLALVFFYAGWVKVSDPTLFAIKVRGYELLSDPWVALVAISLPWMELICALCVVSRRLERGALMWIAGMLLLFLFGLISAMARGLNIDCGCFTESLDRSSLMLAVATDIVLLVIAVRLWRESASEGGLRKQLKAD